ncbi:G-D-S-L family lipolytic protein [Pandoraea thiooxydans]|nr:G-D-S-L family lipolytic protein [Pandoraea thiooxydans]
MGLACERQAAARRDDAARFEAKSRLASLSIFPMKFSRFALSRTVARAAFAIALAPLGMPAWAGGHWVGTWAAAPQAVAQNRAAPSYDRAPTVTGRTVRQIVYSRLAGQRVRVTFSNTFGTQPLAIDEATVALSGGGAVLRPNTERLLSFGGQRAAVIAPGAELTSDPVSLDVPAGAALAVSLYSTQPGAPTTWHKVASQVNYISKPGNYAEIFDGQAYREHTTAYLWLAGVAVDTRSSAFAVAAIGDSITDGLHSTLNENRRWPDALARRLRGTEARHVAILNLGISGNRLLNDSACYGQRLEARFERDALAQPGVRAVILQVGINDINFGATPPRRGLDCDAPHVVVQARDLIAGYRRVIAQAHARGVRILGGTLLPASLPPERERVRQAVNHWIRTSGAFDGVIDFDAALRDPTMPDRLLPRFDCGDHVHPSDAGYAAMAAAVPLGLLVAPAQVAQRGAPNSPLD